MFTYLWDCEEGIEYLMKSVFRHGVDENDISKI